MAVNKKILNMIISVWFYGSYFYFELVLKC